MLEAAPRTGARARLHVREQAKGSAAPIELAELLDSLEPGPGKRTQPFRHVSEEILPHRALVQKSCAHANDRLEVSGKPFVEPFAFSVVGGRADVEELVHQDPIR